MVALSTGLIVGQVFSQSGAPFAGATVHIGNMMGSEGTPIPFEGEKGKFTTVTSKDKGKFALPFAWSGTEIGDVYMSSWVRIHAYTEEAITGPGIQGSRINAKATTEIRTILVKNVLALSQTYMSSFGSIPEISDFAIDIANVFTHMSPTPFWKTTSLWSSENYTLLGAAYLYLKG